MRHSTWLFLGLCLIGCQSQSVSPPVTKTGGVGSEGVPAEVAALMDAGRSEQALASQ